MLNSNLGDVPVSGRRHLTAGWNTDPKSKPPEATA